MRITAAVLARQVGTVTPREWDEAVMLGTSIRSSIVAVYRCDDAVAFCDAQNFEPGTDMA